MDLRINNTNRSDYLFEIGKSKSLSGDFLGSTRVLEEAASLYLSQKEFVNYIECLNILLRIYRELEDTAKISSLREELFDLVWEENIQMTARTRYTLGQCALYKGNLDEALEEFEKSLHQVSKMKNKATRQNNQALILEARIESCFPIYGMASYFVRMKEFDKAEENLIVLEDLLRSFHALERRYSESLLSRLPVSQTDEIKDIKKILKDSLETRERLETSAQLLKTTVYQFESRYIEIENILWNCYEKIKKSKDLYSIVSFFFYLGRNYMNMQDYHQAGIFLNLAKKSIDQDNFKHLARHVQDHFDKLQSISSCNYDLIINLSTNSITERHKGRIDFKNQFILLDLLKMFISCPGESYSKEDMVENIWKQRYDPTVHDNKIYVTIKRLRELVEPDAHRPRYIFRGKDGYYLNSKMKILIKEGMDKIKNQKELVL